MNASPDLIRELRAARPTAPPALRSRVRELAARDAAPSRTRSWWWERDSARRVAVVAMSAAGLALVSAGALGFMQGELRGVFSDAAASVTNAPGSTDAAEGAFTREAAPAQGGALDSTIAPTPGRAQRVSATLTVEVRDADAVSRAAQEALDLTRSLGGHVVSASVATAEEGTATLTVRVPTEKVQDAIVQLSALGRIVSQQVSIDDLQAQLDVLERRERSLRGQIALVVANLESDTLDAAARARLEARLRNLRSELRSVRSGVSATTAEARMATIHVGVVTPGAQGIVPAPSRLDRTLDGALNVLVWEAVVALGIAIVLAPFALLAALAWLGRRFHRRREDERLLAAS